ncbi:hypothetical protein F511_16281 [Dorcoceras hygrometricum]|uniref:Uncharacterized protein n=1 Tax=Dorcoceras hygrometricum TaxID=472368 RepID=A0A2Z7B217_9LAMI|nr:hypothetical protein F511_16281 [Dorcoceras hygrometricum]
MHGLQPNQEAKGAQGPAQQLSTDRTKGSGHEACESVVAIHSSQHTVPEHQQITRPDVAKAHESVVAIHSSHSG